jgi:hypothetical protein
MDGSKLLFWPHFRTQNRSTLLLEMLLAPCSCHELLLHLQVTPATEAAMAKGQLRSNKEPRKPKKDAKKPVAEPALKAPAVQAIRLKDKNK